MCFNESLAYEMDLDMTIETHEGSHEEIQEVNHENIHDQKTESTLNNFTEAEKV